MSVNFCDEMNMSERIKNTVFPTPSGISLDQITKIIEINLLEPLGEKEISKPVESVNDEYIM